MKILILQLARLGDIVQTLPAIQGLKKTHPGCEITLVTRGTFSDAARISPHVDKIVEMPTREILGPLLSEASRREESLGLLETWLTREILATEYDLLLNLTFSPASACLSKLVRAKEKRGVLLGAGGDGYLIYDPWSQYFFAQVLEQNMNIIHLNDLFSRIAGVTEGTWPLEVTEPNLAEPVTPKGKNSLRIGIQIGASKPEKTLNTGVWARLCRVLLSIHENAELVFFGSAAEREHIFQVIITLDEIAPGLADGRFKTLAGELRFDENVPWIRSCDWIVAPDTSIVHLASACGTRVLEIPLGGVRPEETGPYGEGHHVLYPANASAEELSIEIARVIGGEKAGLTVAEAITRLVPCTSGMARNELTPHNFTQEQASGFYMQAYYLLAEFRCAGRQEDIPIPPLGDAGQSKAIDRLVNSYDALCTIRRLSEYGQHYCLKMIENLEDRNLLNDYMAKLTEIEELLLGLRHSVPLIKPLIDTWRVSKDIAYSPAVDAGGLIDILGLTEGCYRELSQNIEIIQQLMQTAVEKAQSKTKLTEKPKEQDIGATAPPDLAKQPKETP